MMAEKSADLRGVKSHVFWLLMTPGHSKVTENVLISRVHVAVAIVCSALMLNIRGNFKVNIFHFKALRDEQ